MKLVNVRELPSLEVEQDVTAQQAVVEDKVDAEVVVVEGEPLLPCLEREALAQLQEERLQLIDDGGLEVVLGVLGPLVEPEELQHQRVLHEVSSTFDHLTVGRQPPDLALIARQREALVKRAFDVPPQLAHRPLVLRGLDLVEAALVRIVDGLELHIVRPSQGKRVVQ